ncbi:unnamed protein product [Caenorhabditis nigoni]
MNYSELFILSFVSKDLNELIKSCHMKTFKSIRSIEYVNDRAKNTCAVYIFDGRKPKNSEKPSKLDDDRIVRLVEQDDSKSGSFQFNFRVSNDYKYPVVFYHHSDKEFVFQSIHNHFLELFGNSIEYTWKESLWMESQGFSTPVIPNLKNVSLRVAMDLDELVGDFSELEDFFSSSSVFKTIHLAVRRDMESLNPESKFYQAESIHIRMHLVDGPDFLRHFRGRHIGLECRRYEKSNLLDFVNRWKAGEAFQNLEYAQIRIMNDNQFLNRILEEIGANFIDANRQPPTYTVLHNLSWPDRNVKEFQMTSHTYVVRATDNRVASVQIEDHKLIFGVWNKTEKEFLKMVE